MCVGIATVRARLLDGDAADADSWGLGNWNERTGTNLNLKLNDGGAQPPPNATPTPPAKEPGADDVIMASAALIGRRKRDSRVLGCVPAAGIRSQPEAEQLML